MKYLKIILLLLLYQNVVGQSIENFTYHAVHIPGSFLKNISIDGNLDEWDWVPKVYIMENQSFVNGNEVSVNDFKVESFVAWSSITNKIYIVAKVTDEIVNTDRLDDDDELEIQINPINLVGELWADNYKLVFFNTFHFSVIPSVSCDYTNLYYGSHWNINKKYLDFKVSNKKNKEKLQTVCYEIQLNLWEYYSPYSSKLSAPLKLEQNSQIGLTMAFNDVDKNANKRDIQLWTFSGYFYGHRAEFCSFFILDPPKLFPTIYDDLIFLNRP